MNSCCVCLSLYMFTSFRFILVAKQRIGWIHLRGQCQTGSFTTSGALCCLTISHHPTSQRLQLYCEDFTRSLPAHVFEFRLMFFTFYQGNRHSQILIWQHKLNTGPMLTVNIVKGLKLLLPLSPAHESSPHIQPQWILSA